jgi:hypothetical protein
MKELIKAMDAVTEMEAPVDAKPIGDLGLASIKWSEWCLRNLQGDLLRRGMAVAVTLAEFDCGLIHPETLSD